VESGGFQATNFPANRLTKMLLAIEDIADRLEQIGTGGGLGDVTGGTELQADWESGCVPRTSTAA
jgi:hypothetical protein